MDTVSLGDSKNQNFHFAEVMNVTGVAFYASELDGILGLGFRTISVDNLPTFVDEAKLS